MIYRCFAPIVSTMELLGKCMANVVQMTRYANLYTVNLKRSTWSFDTEKFADMHASFLTKHEEKFDCICTSYTKIVDQTQASQISLLIKTKENEETNKPSLQPLKALMLLCPRKAGTSRRRYMKNSKSSWTNKQSWINSSIQMH